MGRGERKGSRGEGREGTVWARRWGATIGEKASTRAEQGIGNIERLSREEALTMGRQVYIPILSPLHPPPPSTQVRREREMTMVVEREETRVGKIKRRDKPRGLLEGRLGVLALPAGDSKPPLSEDPTTTRRLL